MATLRRYVFALFATCIALAAGIALGAGPLQGLASATSQERNHNAALSDAVASLRGSATFSEAVTEPSRNALLTSRLTGAAVTVVTLPGASQETTRQITTAVAQAGGQVAVSLQVSNRLVNPAQKTYTASVAETSSNNLLDLPSVASGDTYGLIGALVARAYVGSEASLEVDDEAIALDSELQGAELVAVAGDLRRRGSLVVVVGPGDHATDDVTVASHSIEAQLLSALAAAADGVLVVTPPTGADQGGLLAALPAAGQPSGGTTVGEPASRTLSTLNVSEGSAAAVAAVYALSAVGDGIAGAYGVYDAKAVLPPGLGSTPAG